MSAIPARKHRNPKGHADGTDLLIGIYFEFRSSFGGSFFTITVITTTSILIITTTTTTTTVISDCLWILSLVTARRSRTKGI